MRFSHRLATYAFAIASAGFLASHALAAAPPVGTQAPAFYRANLGSFEITALSDGTVDLPVDKLLLGTKAGEVQKTMGQSFMRIPTPTSVNAYLVNTGSKLVMFDAGAGTLFGPTLGKLVDNLKAAGYQPDQVDEIYITHLHPDHVGGLAANGQRVFANAVVRAEQRDVDFWLSEEQKAKAPADAKGFFDGAMASLKPYADAGKLKPFTGDTELVPGVRAVVTRGHTAGHSTYVIEDQGQRMVVWGDLIHVAAVQFPHPEVAIAFDSDSKNAIQQRRKAFDAAVKSGAIAAGAHLAFPGLGHLRARGRGYEWIPLNYQSDPKAKP